MDNGGVTEFELPESLGLKRGREGGSFCGNLRFSIDFIK